MQYNREEVRNVWERYQAGTATGDDIALLESWYLQFEIKDLIELDVNDIERRLNEVQNNLPQKRSAQLWVRYAAAASLFFGLSIGYYLYRNYTKVDLRKEAALAGIKPGSNRAILKLANGEQIPLDERGAGVIAEQNGISLTRTSSGELVFLDQQKKNSSLSLNTITIPNGGQFQLQLPDGTKVWLNAASSLSFPISFAGQKQRRVELTGEAYFEVAKDKSKPFTVHTVRQDLQVLGTHFNINAYDNEQSVKTTLLEGSVSVTPARNTTQPKILKPGEQSILSNQVFDVVPVNTLLATDWKNDEFRFKEEPLSSILRKVSRWYDVRIEYQIEFKSMPTFTGSVSRSDDVSTVLKMLEDAGDIHFKIKEKVIYVTK